MPVGLVRRCDGRSVFAAEDGLVECDVGADLGFLARGAGHALRFEVARAWLAR